MHIAHLHRVRDVLQLGRRDVRPLPLSRRRRDILEDHLVAIELGLPARRLKGHGAVAWATVQARGYEGLVAKDPTSTYHEVRAALVTEGEDPP